LNVLLSGFAKMRTRCILVADTRSAVDSESTHAKVENCVIPKYSNCARSFRKEANMRTTHRESHLIRRIGWLRAAVLGANDGIISTASLVAGVAAISTGPTEVLVAGTAGLVAGALSMAADEYVSVSSQADTETADLAREARELADQPSAELEELSQIYIARGIEPALARQVSIQLTAADALGTHARDELGLAAQIAADPLQAAIASAATFAVGAAVPVSWGAFAMGATAAIGALVGHTI
jgi:VIT1/CCC1 family predicted Fe2+/Mn2+ transporter